MQNIYSCKRVMIFFMILQIKSSHSGFPNDFYKPIKQREITGDPGTPLFLTPLIQNNQIQEAQEASKVIFDGFNSTVSYSGFLTTDESYNSSLFFWYFPAEIEFENAPLLLWLQGGTGTSSLIGLFVENGPFVVNDDGKVEAREYSWTKDHSVIYIDNPVGTGFSMTNNGYAKNQTKAGADLHNALTQFLTLFPELQERPFFISGESYSGKYIPALAHTIHQRNQDNATLNINLQGILIGDGLTDPINQIGYAPYLYELGLVDANDRDEISLMEANYKILIEKENYALAAEAWGEILGAFGVRTGFTNMFNFLYPNDPHIASEYNFGQFVQTSEVRKALHVGDTPYGGDNNVSSNLHEDLPKSVAPWVSEILSHYRAAIYNGQVDVVVAYPLTLNYLQNLDFSSADDYKTVPRKLWYVGDELAGYVKQAGNLTEILVRNAGHLVPGDQPKWALDMVYKFTRSLAFEDSPSTY